MQECNDAEIPVAMVYTSGTTGKSKAVVLSNRNLNALYCQYAYANIKHDRGQSFMNSLPPFIAFGLVFAMHMPLCMGFTEVLVLDPTPTNAGKYYAKYKPNYFVNGKAAIENVMSNPKILKMDLNFVEVLAAGGEAMPITFEEKVNSFLREHNSQMNLSIGYGMTEVAATVVTSNPKVNRMGTVGIPLPGTSIKIVEPGTTNEVPYNTEGEICFHAPTMMLGYYRKPEETEQVIKIHDDGLKWVHSGDFGKISEDGFLSVIGRIKRMVLVHENGTYHKIFTKNIEEEIEKIEGVLSTVIVGRPKEIVENELVAYIVGRKDLEQKTVIEKINRKLSADFEKWERPVEYHFIKELPRTTVGKVDYRKLEEMAKEEV